jgi:hypothetical protein
MNVFMLCGAQIATETNLYALQNVFQFSHYEQGFGMVYVLNLISLFE